MEHKEVWKEGRSRRNRISRPSRQWGSRQVWRKVGDKEKGVTIFFRNFPEWCDAEDLWKCFATVGEVKEVFIPAKRDIMGKRFGFARYSTDCEADELIDGMNKLWFGSYLLKAYTPKFNRRMESSQVSLREGLPAEDTKRTQSPTIISNRRRDDTSFAEVLKGRSENASTLNKVGEKAEVPENRLQHRSTEEEKKWLEGAFTGLLKNGFSWKEHGEEIMSEVTGNLNITNIGSNMILIRSSTDKSTEEVLEGLDEWKEFWMTWLRPSKNTDVNLRRQVWTRWIGVPLHIWNLRFFCVGCADFGGLMELHESTRSRSRLDEAFVLITTGLDTMDRVMQCEIDEAVFSIRVEEIGCVKGDEHLNQFVSELSASESCCSEWEDGVDEESVQAFGTGRSELSSGG